MTAALASGAVTVGLAESGGRGQPQVAVALAAPSAAPTVVPAAGTPAPTPSPTATPTTAPTVEPTAVAASRSTARPTLRPTAKPAVVYPALTSAKLDWKALAQCESGGDPRSTNGGAGNYYGLYQFSVSTWRSVGGTGLPSKATAAEQTYRAELLYAQQGSSPWPTCGHHLFDK